MTRIDDAPDRAKIYILFLIEEKARLWVEFEDKFHVEESAEDNFTNLFPLFEIVGNRDPHEMRWRGIEMTLEEPREYVQAPFIAP